MGHNQYLLLAFYSAGRNEAPDGVQTDGPKSKRSEWVSTHFCRSIVEGHRTCWLIVHTPDVPDPQFPRRHR